MANKSPRGHSNRACNAVGYDILSGEQLTNTERFDRGVAGIGAIANLAVGVGGLYTGYGVINAGVSQRFSQAAKVTSSRIAAAFTRRLSVEVLEGSIGGFAPGYMQALANKAQLRSFKKTVQRFGVKVEWTTEGKSSFSPHTGTVRINTIEATPGTLLDEFSHIFSRSSGKGAFLPKELAIKNRALYKRAKALGGTDKLEFDENTLYHQLEYANFFHSGHKLTRKLPSFIRAIPAEEIRTFLEPLGIK